MKWERSLIGGLHQLEILDCPIEVLAALAERAGADVTVENYRPIRGWNEWFESSMTIPPGTPVRAHLIRNAVFDVALKNEDFCSAMRFWDQDGVYAIFTERSPIPFRACDLQPIARYRALMNFGFVLEFALAGPSSQGVSSIVSPRGELVDFAEKLLSGELHKD